MRIGAATLLAAAVAVAVAVPGVGKWILAAVLAGLASAIGGLVARGADRAIARGHETVVDPTPKPPIVVTAYQDGLNGHIGPMPEDLEGWINSTGWVATGSTGVHLTVEAAVDRAVIITGLSMQVESRSAPPSIDGDSLSFLSPAPMDPHTFDLHISEVDLSAPTSFATPAEGVPAFPYTVSSLDPEYFIIRTELSSPGYVTWRVRVHWTCSGQSGVVIADEEGQPFRLVSHG